MIASLHGIIKKVFIDFIIVDVNGIGFKVELADVIKEVEGSEIDLLIHTQVGQQGIKLFGFKEEKSYSFFQELLNISGVGPKTAASLIRNIGVDSIVEAIKSADATAITGFGVGVKTAKKIILELNDKYEKVDINTIVKSGNKNITSEIYDILINLGYSKIEITAMLKNVKIDTNSNTEDIIKQILKKK